MIALPTARGWLILAMTFGAVSVALVNVGLATALAASAFAAFWLASFVMAQCSVYGIRVTRGGNGDGYRDDRERKRSLLPGYGTSGGNTRSRPRTGPRPGGAGRAALSGCG